MNIEERNKIIEEIYRLGLVQNYMKKIGYLVDFELYDDIQQELFLAICEIKDSTWEDLLNQGKEDDRLYAIRGYISGLIYRQIRSRNSKIYSRLKKHKEHEFTQTDWTDLENIADDPFDYEYIDLQ